MDTNINILQHNRMGFIKIVTKTFF